MTTSSPLQAAAACETRLQNLLSPHQSEYDEGRLVMDCATRESEAMESSSWDGGDSRGHGRGGRGRGRGRGEGWTAPQHSQHVMEDAREDDHALRRGRTALAHGPRSSCATEDMICAHHEYHLQKHRGRGRKRTPCTPMLAITIVMIIMHLSSRMSMGAAMTGAAPCIRGAAVGRDSHQGQPVFPYDRASFLDEEGRRGMQAPMPAIESMGTDRLPTVLRILNTSCWFSSSRSSRRDTAYKTASTTPPTTMSDRSRQEKPLQQPMSQWEHAAMTLAKGLFATQFPLERIPFMAQTRPHALRHAASTANTISTTPTMTNTAMTTTTVTMHGNIATGVDAKQQHDPPPARARLPTDGGELIAQQDRSKCHRHPQRGAANTDSRARPMSKTVVEVKQPQEASPTRAGIAADTGLAHAPHGRPAGGFCARRGPVSTGARTTTTTTQLTAPTQTTEATVPVQEPSDTPPARRHTTGDSGLTAAGHEDCWVGLLPPPGASVVSTTSTESCAAPSRTPRAHDGLFAMLSAFLSGCIFLVAQMPSYRALKRKSVCHRKQPQPPRRLQCALFVVMVAVGCFVVTVGRMDTVSATTTTTQDRQHVLSVAPSWDEISAAVHKCFAKDEHEVCHIVIRTDEQSRSSTSAIGRDDSGDFVPIHIPRPHHIHLLSATAPSATTMCDLNDPNHTRAASSFFALDDGARLCVDATLEAMFTRWQSVTSVSRARNAGTDRRLAPLVAPIVQVLAFFETTCSIQQPPVSDLRCWGRNEHGQLGQGDIISRGDSPWEMGANMTAVSLGMGLTPRPNVSTTSTSWHSCLVLDPTGSVKCFGRGDWGELGYGDTDRRGDNPGEMGDALPAVDVGSSLPILQLAQGSFHSCVLFAESLQIKCWGYNSDGQLGYEDTNTRGDGPGEMGGSLPFVDLGPGLGVVELIMGFQHTCSRLNDTNQGGLKCWGRNTFGQLGYGDVDDRGDDASEMDGALPMVNVSSTGIVHVTQGDGGWDHTCILLNSSAVKCIGRGWNGPLGYGDEFNRGDDPGEMGDSLPEVDVIGTATGVHVIQVQCGGFHSCALISDGTLKCWGYGFDGQLGQENSGSIGDGLGEMGDSLPVIQLGGHAVQSAALGGHYTCVHLTDGSVKCFGQNSFGQLGLGDTNDRGDNAGEMGSLPVVNIGPVALTSAPTMSPAPTSSRPPPLIAPVAHVFALYEATCSIQAPPTSDLRCWGVNQFGQLGQGDIISRGDLPWQMGANLSAVNLGTGLTPRPNVTTTSLGEHVCLVIDPDGSVKCFGRGDSGQLGYGDVASRGDNPGELGDTLPAVDFGSSHPPILQLAQGDYHSCVLFADVFRIKCWGGNVGGQLGYEDRDSRGDGPGDMGDLLPFVDLGTGLGALHLFAGSFHTCACVNDTRQGGLKCWGDNGLGKLGYGDIISRGGDPGEMGDSLPLVSVSSSGHVHVTQGDGATHHTCVLLNDSAVKCFGNGGSGQLGYEDIAVRGDEPGEMGDSLPAVDVLGSATGVYVTHVHCGSSHSCALISDGSMKCWGYGEFGQLGHEDSYNIGDDVGEMGDSLAAVRLGANDVISASLGRWHTCAHLNDSSVKCFGSNGVGQLGQGDTDDRGDNVGEMGSALPVVDIGPVSTAVPTFAPTVFPPPLPTGTPSVAPTFSPSPTMAPTLSIATILGDNKVPRVFAEVQGADTVYVRWPAQSDPRMTVLGYRVAMQTAKTGSFVTVSEPAQNWTTITGLSPATHYGFKVAVVATRGVGSLSDDTAQVKTWNGSVGFFEDTGVAVRVIASLPLPACAASAIFHVLEDVAALFGTSSPECTLINQRTARLQLG